MIKYCQVFAGAAVAASLFVAVLANTSPTRAQEVVEEGLEDDKGEVVSPEQPVDEALAGDPFDGEIPTLNEGEEIVVSAPAAAGEPELVEGEERLGASIERRATGGFRKEAPGSKVIFDGAIGKPLGVEQQVKSTCVQMAKTCTGWKVRCSQWAKAFGAKTCTGWTTSCVQEAKTCSGWKIETRSLLHSPRLVVRYSGRNLEGIERDINDAVEKAGAASLVAAYASGGAAAYKTFIETLKVELGNKAYEAAKLDASIHDETEWSGWSTKEVKSKKKKKPKKKKTKKVKSKAKKK